MADRTENYTVAGNIRVFFDSGSGYRDLGNLTSPSVEVTTEVLEHFSSRGGIRARDKSRITQRGLTITGNMDEINADNLLLEFGGDSLTSVSTGAVAITDEVVTLEGTDTTEFALPLLTGTPGVTVKSLDGGTTYSNSTDYNVDTLGGGIKRVSGSTIGDGDEVKATYNWGAPAHKSFNIQKGTLASGHVRMIMLPTEGQQMVLTGLKAEIIANGTINFDDTAWLELPVSINILEDLTAPSSPFGLMRTWLV